MVNSRRWLPVLYHLGAWVFFGCLFFYYITQRLPLTEKSYRLGMTLSSFSSYALIIYGYVYGLYPNFRAKIFSIGGLLFASVLLFSIVVSLRMYAENLWVRPLSTRGGSIYDWGTIHFAYALTTSFIAFLIAFLFTALEEKIIMQKRQEILKRKQVEAELQLLKYQLQPHFLFNFLNNLYASVYKTLPAVADQIEKGAELMRYYLYNTTLRTVPISSETAYIHNIIELEKSRLSIPHEISCEIMIREEILLPPMLFAPVLENLFKHGLSSEQPGTARIELEASRKGVYFCVSNPLYGLGKASETPGTGLENLKERLVILYGTKFILTTEQKDNRFITTLILPPYENSLRHY